MVRELVTLIEIITFQTTKINKVNCSRFNVNVSSIILNPFSQNVEKRGKNKKKNKEEDEEKNIINKNK